MTPSASGPPRTASRSCAPLAVALAAALPLAFPAPGPAAVAALLAADEPSAAARLELLYLANEGVIVSDGGRRVAIDALFGDGLPDYPAVPAAERAALEGGRGDFGQIDLLLATHAHADHFDPAAVARHLAANPDALFVSTPAAVAALLALPDGSAFAERTRGLLPAEGAARETIAWRGIRVTAFNLHHGRELVTPVDHLGFLVELGGRRIVHLGDTEATLAELTAALGRERGRIDLLLVPYWRLLPADDRAGLRRALEPKRLAAFHLPRPESPADWFGAPGSLPALRLHLTREWPGIEFLDRSGATFRLGGD